MIKKSFSISRVTVLSSMWATLFLCMGAAFPNTGGPNPPGGGGGGANWTLDVLSDGGQYFAAAFGGDGEAGKSYTVRIRESGSATISSQKSGVVTGGGDYTGELSPPGQGWKHKNTKLYDAETRAVKNGSLTAVAPDKNIGFDY